MKEIASNKEYEQEEFNDIVGEDIANSEFEGCMFKTCDFTQKTLFNCNFRECIFIGCSFTAAKFTGTKLLNCIFKKCRLSGVDWTLASKELGIFVSYEHCDLSYSGFTDLHLQKTLFDTCKLENAEFSSCLLNKAKFGGCDLTNTQFDNCDLTEASFKGAVNYAFDIRKNKCTDTLFDYPEVMRLLVAQGIKIDGF